MGDTSETKVRWRSIVRGFANHYFAFAQLSVAMEETAEAPVGNNVFSWGSALTVLLGRRIVST